ncbi:Recombinase [Bradyrhizobium sp. ORS 375]|uniref:recombinase family protein n=1 Tax=Bradyrhizobium sp. (strain ORS 375) TaxID=566679 RepID=UPI00024064BB|nr:recombinase family protein [Bradyrhizobium sp. ORS 375]CCD95918.1 Recombinase [Bradyrhizobium sp. ORS 375]
MVGLPAGPSWLQLDLSFDRKKRLMALTKDAEGMVMVNALVVRETHLPQSPNGRAAQYVRMSTDYQRYSIQNQAAVIAAYAHAHGLSIVKTYADHGESGLKIKNRPGLAKLIDDVSSGRTGFDHILVYDISRWGRFQDVDEAAHYEFICKQAGIKVSYCAEQFDNDGSMLSNIVKNLKRVMAAEYSRELSQKVHAGSCRFARMGFNLGGQTMFGLQRVLVDERLQQKKVLLRGDRKYLMTDHVRLKPGDVSDRATIAWVFRRFVQLRSETAIARELNARAVPAANGRVWNRGMVGRILRNENYLGNIVYNRRSRKLGGISVYNPPEEWVRGEAALEPTVERDLFQRVQKIIAERRVDLSEEEMLLRLRQTLKKKGSLSPSIINSTVGLPCCKTYMDHFGTLRRAYELVGFTPSRRCDYLDVRRTWSDRLLKLSSRVSEQLKTRAAMSVRFGEVKGHVYTAPEHHLVVGPKCHLVFRIAFWTGASRRACSPFWTVSCRHLPEGWIIAIRLGEHNTSILDYVVLPIVANASLTIRFQEQGRLDHGVLYFKTEAGLARAVARLVTRRDHTGRSRPQAQSRARKRSRTCGPGAGLRHR